jgi:nicotine oxidoreductase
MSDRYDAIVIGGGLAGVTAARELEFRGLRTLLLEARDRLGGRMWVTEFGGAPIEMGGMNVYWTEPHLWAEITRYGLEIVEVETFDTYGVATDAGLQRFHRTEAIKQLGVGFDAFFDEVGTAISRPFDPLFNLERITELDRLSVRDRYDQLSIPAEAQAWLKPWLTMRCGGSMEIGALVWMLKFFAFAGWNWMRGLEMSGRYRLKDGTAPLIQGIAGHSGADIRLESPVAEIVDDGSAVHVTTKDGETFSASAAVVATSANLWPHIEFSPGLSKEKTEASGEGLQNPNLTKLWALARGEVENIYVQRPSSDDHPIIHLRKDQVRPDGTTAIIGFSVDPTLDTDDKELIARLFTETLPMPNAEIVDVIAHAWGADEYTRGGQTLLRPRQMTKYSEALRRPEGRLSFATSDIAHGPGGMDGAIETAISAAADAHRTVSGKTASERYAVTG